VRPERNANRDRQRHAGGGRGLAPGGGEPARPHPGLDGGRRGGGGGHGPPRPARPDPDGPPDAPPRRGGGHAADHGDHALRDPGGDGHRQRQHLAGLRRDGARRPRCRRHPGPRAGRGGDRGRAAGREDRDDRQAGRAAGPRPPGGPPAGDRDAPAAAGSGRLDGRPQGPLRPAPAAAPRLERGGGDRAARRRRLRSGAGHLVD